MAIDKRALPLLALALVGYCVYREMPGERRRPPVTAPPPPAPAAASPAPVPPQAPQAPPSPAIPEPPPDPVAHYGARQLSRLYRENGLAGDAACKGKRLAISGVMHSVTQVLNVPILHFGGQTNGAVLAFNGADDQGRSLLAAQRRGGRFTVICTCRELGILGNVEFGDCVFPDGADLIRAFPGKWKRSKDGRYVIGPDEE